MEEYLDVTKSENDMWMLIDEWIKKNVQTNECLLSEKGNDYTKVYFKYTRITANRLHQYWFNIDMHLLRFLTNETTAQILTEVLNGFRNMD